MLIFDLLLCGGVVELNMLIAENALLNAQVEQANHQDLEDLDLLLLLLIVLN